jgi:GNAT superfamily N-acetyltransferase
VAQDEKSIVGFASGGPERSGHLHYDGELYAIYILDAYQCQGIGRELVSRVAERLLEQGMESLVVWVLAVTPSRRFYERLGGKEAAEKTVHIGGVQLDEVAYGWCDIRRLAERGPDTSSVLF